MDQRHLAVYVLDPHLTICYKCFHARVLPIHTQKLQPLHLPLQKSHPDNHSVDCFRLQSRNVNEFFNQWQFELKVVMNRDTGKYHLSHQIHNPNHLARHNNHHHQLEP